MKRRAKDRKQKREDRRPILKKLRAALLRSFWEQHDEKMFCVGGVHGVTGTLGSPTAILIQTNGFGGRTTTLTRLLIGAV